MLTAAETTLLRDLLSANESTIYRASYELLKLDTFNLLPCLDGIAANLPAGSRPALLDYRTGVKLRFEVYKYHAQGKCHCDFYEQHGFFFHPDSEYEKPFLTLIGDGNVDIPNFLDEKIYKCNRCGNCWVTNENTGWHAPFHEWRRIDCNSV
ncbi:hypothetical protein [Spirosoma daeguense]